MTDTKNQLTEIAKDDLINNLPARSSKLIINAQNEQNETPEQVLLDVHIRMGDLKPTQEGADVIIPCHS